MNIFKELALVSPNSMWGIAIHTTLQTLDDNKINQLICDLQSQNKDQPEIMKAILGSSYESIINYNASKD